MCDETHLARVTQKLLSFGNTLPAEALFPTLVPEAAPFVVSNPYAFAMAVCLDRGAKADLIWTIPYYLHQILGHLDPHRIYEMSLDALADLFAHLPRKPRFVNDAPQTLHDLTRIVVEECGGDAELLWAGRRAADVNRIFRSVHGVGPGIASMGVLLIEKAFGIRFSDLDRTRMDIKPDVHTVRVSFRLGASKAQTTNAAIEASRCMNPSFPGGLDGALWEIGRRWCFASNPNCAECPMNEVCKRIDV